MILKKGGAKKEMCEKGGGDMLLSLHPNPLNTPLPGYMTMLKC